MERKIKTKKGKWQKFGRMYICISKDRALGFRGGKPIEIDIDEQTEKGYAVQKIYVNMTDALEHWKIGFKKFYKIFKVRSN